MKYVLLFEEFDPGEAKSKISDRSKAIQARMVLRKDAIKKASKAKDKIRVEMNKTNLEINQLDLKKLELKGNIVDLKVQKQKEKEANKKV